MRDFKLLGLCGSLRKASFNLQLLHEAAYLLPGSKLTLGDLNLPLYNGDDEAQGGIPAKVQALAAQIVAADAVVIATPEYNQSYSGVLHNALDWVSRTDGKLWRDKPVAIISAAAGRTGGARAQYALRLGMNQFRPLLSAGPEVMVASAHTEFDAAGHLTGALYISNLTELMAGLQAQATLG